MTILDQLAEHARERAAEAKKENTARRNQAASLIPPQRLLCF